MATMELLEALSLTKVFRHQWTMRPIPVLRDVSLSLRGGEVFGLIGPNGAGKTTTIKLLLALLRPTEGHVLFEGKPVNRPAARAGMGFLPEQPYFYDYLTVEETLRFYGQLYGMRGPELGHRIKELVEQLRLDSLVKRTMRELSKGNLQRAGIAQAILHRPKLAILDEPMSGLDPAGRKEMRDLIAALRSEGTTVIFSSHILPDTQALCDRVAILVGGRVRETIDLMPNGRPEGPFDLTATDLPPAVVSELRQLAMAELLSGPERWCFRFRDRARLQQAMARIVAANGFIETLVPEQPSLEDRLLSYVDRETATS
jgi:ABC-2 type transport system ATP-binding protein